MRPGMVAQMSNKAKQKGTTFETLILRYIRDIRGLFRSAYRTATKGSFDTGDINGLSGPHRQVIIQCKNQRTFKLSEWINDTKEQASQPEVGGNALPVLIVKRPGVGAANPGRNYMVLELDDGLDLLAEAGYK